MSMWSKDNPRWQWEPAGPLTPGQMAASLALMDNLDAVIEQPRNITDALISSLWKSVRECLQELIDGTVDRANIEQLYPYTIYQNCREEDWDSARAFKDAFAHEIGHAAGTIADVGGDLKDSMLDALSYPLDRDVDEREEE